MATRAFLLLALVACVYGLDTVRWCTISSAEQDKCEDMKEAFNNRSITPALSCTQHNDHSTCIDRIGLGELDAVTLDGGDIYDGGKAGKLAPVAGENYNEAAPDASYWAVAVARIGSQFGINELENKNSCHTGIGKTSGWNVPVGHLINIGSIEVNDECDVPQAVGDFFVASCAPGAKSDPYDDGSNPASLCELCIGDGASKCVRNDNEPYYDYSGAFRCLAEEAGDVAFVKHTTVPENTDGNGQDTWNRDLLSSNFQLLCKDNSRGAISTWDSCNLAKVPSHAVVTNPTMSSGDRADIFKMLNDGQEIFGDDDNINGFKMFDSSAYGGKNLLFKDSTVNLIDVGDKDTYEEWLGEDYLNDLNALNCDTGAAPPTVQSSLFLALVTMIVAAFVR